MPLGTVTKRHCAVLHKLFEQMKENTTRASLLARKGGRNAAGSQRAFIQRRSKPIAWLSCPSAHFGDRRKASLCEPVAPRAYCLPCIKSLDENYCNAAMREYNYQANSGEEVPTANAEFHGAEASFINLPPSSQVWTAASGCEVFA